MTTPALTPGQFVDQVGAALADKVAGLTFQFGGEHVDDAKNAPRVVLVPTRDVFERGQKIRGVGPQPRSLGTQRAGYTAHIWARAPDPATSGAHIDAVHELERKLVACIRKVARADFTLMGGEWSTQARTQAGRVYLLDFSVNYRITDDVAWTTVGLVPPPSTPGTSATVANTTTIEPQS